MIRSVRGRRSFAALHRHGHRASTGPLRVTYNADATDEPRLAFAIPRTVGTAVVRNRVRRRLRAVFEDVARREPTLVPAGDYVVAMGTSEFTTDEAHRWLTSTLERLVR